VQTARKWRLNSAHVIAVIALFVALGGTAWAAVHLAKNSVKAKNIAKNAVTTKKIKNAAVTEPKIANGSVTAKKIAPGVLSTAGPSDADAGSLLGPINPAGLPSGGTDLVTLAQLPAGNYVISGKLLASNTAGASRMIDCTLSAGSDTDQSKANLASSGSAGDSDTLAFLAVHSASAQFAAILRCSSTFGEVSASNIKVAAIHVGNLRAH
jgi:hypothetical protein